ncbi:MAG: hypothetical protein E6I59_08740 [Chloroflexi bacterium]|nr:MAG: hypothetical protein E6I59_08740 [Chloroflexota bacterium]
MTSRDEQVPGEQSGRTAQRRRIEIGIVEGDAMIVGGASQVFLRVHDTSSVEDIVENDHTVVRIARLPGKSELHIPSDVEVRVHEIAGNGQVLHVSERVQIGKVKGNFIVVDAPRGVVAEVGGDVVLDTSLGADAEYVVRANANVTFRTNGEINARFVAQTSRGEILTRLPLMVERGRRRNLVGVIGHGDATVTLRSMYGNIAIIAADSDEREYTMNKESTSDNKEREREGARRWEGGFGKHRFRAGWEREPGYAQFFFQGPFVEDDPDGFGIPYSPDFGFEWERGRGARAYGEYEERWEDMREKTERAARKAAEHAKRYARRATRHMRDMDWEAVEREVLAAVEKAMGELEETLVNIRRNWNKRQEQSESSAQEQRSKAQRVRVEYDKVDDPLDEDVATSSTATSSSRSLSREERDAQRRVILEELRTGAISLEEAERRINDLD